MRNRENFLILTGPAGTGKTDIVMAMCEWVVAAFDTYRVHIESDLYDKMHPSDHHWATKTELENFIDDQFILIDDIGSHNDSSWVERILKDTIDFRYRNRLCTVFTTNLSKYDFYKRFHPRIGSRLFATENTVIDFTGLPDYRELGF